MTTTSDLIRDRLTTDLTDWRVSGADVAAVVAALDRDSSLDATIRDLGRDGLALLFQRVTGTAELASVLQIVAGRSRGAQADARAGLVAASTPLMIPRVGAHTPGRLGYRIHHFTVREYFDICADLGAAVRRLGLEGHVACAAPATSHTCAERYSAFSGSGATGQNATYLSTWDGFMSVAGDGKNPISTNLMGYFGGLSSAERLGQARQVVCQPISTLFPKVYAGVVPGRAFVMGKAGNVHNLEGRLIAAAVLTEARDQSRREDAGELQAATMLGRNTSIGLGQVVVSTARRGVLFSDVLTTSVERGLDARQIATLLASDEFNLFAVAKYIRSVADSADATPAAIRAHFQAWQPGIDFTAFRRHSRNWPIENVRALGSEYTSRPWDRGIVAGWGLLWGHAYDTYGRSGISFR